MLKFIRGKGHQPTPERLKLQKELFAFRKTVHHGFPNKPTCLAWDPSLRLMGIGTATGAIKVLGKPGVEFYGHHNIPDVSVTKLIFIPNQGRLVSLCDDNSLHLWEINDDKLDEIKSQSLEGKLKKISVMCLEGSEEHLLLGTEGGNIYLLNLSTFEMSDTIIYQDVVIDNVPEDYKINPGAVEALSVQPDNPDNLLIGYNRGLMVLWNTKLPAAEQIFISAQSIESVCWCKENGKFLSSHNDGSITQWNVSSPDPDKEPIAIYGPHRCKAITKILSASSPSSKEDMKVFSGGLARSAYSDRHTISVVDSDRHVVFDFTSKVIDFFIGHSGEEDLVLVVLAEEELVALQLNAENWPMLTLPYLVSLHASAVTCSTYISDIPLKVWDDIVAAGKQQLVGKFSDAAWLIDGGECEEEKEGEKKRDLLLTGHEDGSIRMWDASSVAMLPLYKFSSTSVMKADDDDDILPPADDDQDQDEWPPFKKVGSFDPYSDDPRLAVKKVTLCPETGTLVVAGTAGHVIVAKLGLDNKKEDIKVTKMDIVSSRDGFVWKGHKELGVRETVDGSAGFQAKAILQVHPPAAVTALALHSGWGLIAAGTAHGMALFDYFKQAPVAIKCTLNPNDMSGLGDAPISRRKSFKKSLRESFRRLRKGRSQRQEGKRGATTTAASTPPRTLPQPTSSTSGDIEAKPVERAIEARQVDDALGSMVRCLTFAKTYIVNVQNTTPTLWVGTNNGTVYVYTLAIPPISKRPEESVSSQLGKEIQLKHRAPVMGVSVMDSLCHSVDTSRRDNHPPPHKVIISSEEQIKVFTLPTLKPVCKLKLTAGEGARVRRTILAKFYHEKYCETCLMCLTNLGDVIVLNLPELRRQINAAVVRREDINGISSLAFTEDGEAVYLHSSSELQRVSLSASRVTVARCKVHLPPGARKPLIEPDNAKDKKEEKSPEEEENEVRERVEIRENGVSDSNHDLTLSSVGDITIDSVKDHLTNNVTTMEESRVVTEIVRNEVIKTETSSEVIKTLVISNDVIITNPQPTESA